MPGVPGVEGWGVTAPQRLDLNFLVSVALRRVRHGGVSRVGGGFHWRGSPMAPGLLLEVYEQLLSDGLLAAAEPDEYGTQRVSLTQAGQSRYVALVQAQRANLTGLPPTTVESMAIESPAGHRSSSALAPPGGQPEPDLGSGPVTRTVAGAIRHGERGRGGRRG